MTGVGQLGKKMTVSKRADAEPPGVLLTNTLVLSQVKDIP